MEYCKGGSLASKCEQLDEEQMKQYIAQIVIGLAYLHKKNIIHRVENRLF